MEGKFIYVFDEYTKNKLIAFGYRMLCENNTFCVFENNNVLKFEAGDVRCVYSDTLTF